MKKQTESLEPKNIISVLEIQQRILIVELIMKKINKL